MKIKVKKIKRYSVPFNRVLGVVQPGQRPKILVKGKMVESVGVVPGYAVVVKDG